MSSCLCKNLEGAIFPLQVEAMKDRVDNAVHAFDIHKADHRPGPSPDLDEQAFDDVHMNPVQRGLVENAREWEWSSACWFAQGEGPLAMDEIRLPTSPAGWI